MTASRVKKQIQQLPPTERTEVGSVIRHDDSAIRLSPAELGALAQRMAESSNDNEASGLEEKIITGFYETK